MTWEETLILAANRRARVRLVDGTTGTLVYAPGDRTRAVRKVRHGNRDECGVRLEGHPRDRITSVPQSDIVEVLDD